MAGSSEMGQAVIDEVGKRGLNDQQTLTKQCNLFKKLPNFVMSGIGGIAPQDWPSTLFILAGYRLCKEGSQPKPLSSF